MTPDLELELPLGGSQPTQLQRSRFEHLERVAGIDRRAALLLSRRFDTLRAVYTAPEAELARVVGAVSAARIRWFLDAPLGPEAGTSGRQPHP